MPLFDIFWAMLWLFLFITWIAALISVLGDVFRRRDMGGGLKALWVALLILLPWVGVLAYFITAGDGIARRRAEEARDEQDAIEAYIRDAAGGDAVSPADELRKLAELRDQGVLTEDEFAAQKARLLA